MEDSKTALPSERPTGITPKSVHLVTRISNYVVGLAEDPKLRGPVFLDCLIRSHADSFGVARVSEEQLANEAGVTSRCIRQWLNVAEERFGYKVVRHPWTDERGRLMNEYWLEDPTSWSQVPTAMLRLPAVPYQSKLLLCTMARVSSDKAGSRMPTTLAKLMGYSKPKDVWKWLQPVRGLVELWRKGDSKKLFWSLPGGLDMTMDRVADPTGGEPEVTWMGLQDQAPLVPVDPPKTGTASSSTEDPLDKPKTMEDASSDAFQISRLLDEESSEDVVGWPQVAATGADVDEIKGMPAHWGKQGMKATPVTVDREQERLRKQAERLTDRVNRIAQEKIRVDLEEGLRRHLEDEAGNVVRLRDFA